MELSQQGCVPVNRDEKEGEYGKSSQADCLCSQWKAAISKFHIKEGAFKIFALQWGNKTFAWYTLLMPKILKNMRPEATINF